MTMPPDPDPDISLAGPRTALAWRRTGLGYAAVTLTALRGDVKAGTVLAVLVTAAAGLTLAWRQSRTRAPSRPADGRWFAVAAAIAVAVGALHLQGIGRGDLAGCISDCRSEAVVHDVPHVAPAHRHPRARSARP